MSLETDFIAVMQADDALMEMLPGGVYSAIEVGEISRQKIPAAFDENMELLACALVKMGIETPVGPYPESVQTPVQVFFYERETSTHIDDASVIAFALFNYKKIGTGTWRIEYESGAWNQTDDVLNASMCLMRFNAIRMKQPFIGGS